MAYRGHTIAVVVPAHDEERLIGRVITGMPPFVDMIVVVDDGSRDGTVQRVVAASDPRVTLIAHPSRKGVGAAIRSGYSKAIEMGADIAVVMPGDAQADPADLPVLLTPLIQKRCDYSKGNRLSPAALSASMPLVRRWGNRVLSALTRVAICNRAVHDSQCGYTAITRHALVALLRLPFCDGYGYPNEILCDLAILGKRTMDVPVRAVYADEESGIRIPSFAVKMVFILTRCAFRRVVHATGSRSA